MYRRAAGNGCPFSIGETGSHGIARRTAPATPGATPADHYFVPVTSPSASPGTLLGSAIMEMCWR